MAFIVNQQGRFYKQDCGAKTGSVAGAMKAFKPDPTWSVSPD